jgi:hypothetical protein
MKKLDLTSLQSLEGGNFCPVTDPMRYLYCNECSAGYVVDAVLNGSILKDPVKTLFPGVCPD